MYPVKIDIKERKLHIIWDDKSESLIPLAVLRRNCPCAHCVTERHNKPENYIPLLSTASLTLKDIKPVGSYALQLNWQDEHDSGIYNYDFLRALSFNSENIQAGL